MNNRTYDLFISYAQENRPWVEGYLLDTLEAAGVRVHTEEAFALGVPRLLEFEKAVKTSKRTLLVLTPAYLAENFVQFVDLLAQSYGLETATWPVIPLLLEPADLPTRLAMLTLLDATDPDEWEVAIARLLQTFEQPLPQTPPMPDCPYPGMLPFAEADSARFFGREAEIQEMLERLRLHSFLTVIGPSGSGKSSLVYAGLLPALRKSHLFGKGEWRFHTMRPGEKPYETLKAMLNKLQRGVGGLQEDTLLFVDQFEETFTSSREEGLNFQETILKLTRVKNLYIVLTVRADFYTDLMASPLWEHIQEHRLEVTPLDAKGLRAAIVQPAEQSGVFIESALVERLLADAAGEPGVLPLVQETLVLLWEKIERRFLPMRAYASLVMPRQQYGEAPMTGLQVAIARRADHTLQQLSQNGKQIARRIFLRLIQFGEGRADTRRQQLMDQLRSENDNPTKFEGTLRALANSRLITLSGEESQTEGDSQRKVDISHEALISGWPTLQQWIADRREAEMSRRQLENKAAEWVRLGAGAGGLLDEIEYHEAQRWLENPDIAELGYSPELVEFMRTSRGAINADKRQKEATQRRELKQAQALAAEQEQRADEQARASKRFQRIAIGLVAVVLLAMALAGVSFQTWRNLVETQGNANAAIERANEAGIEAADKSTAAAYAIMTANYAGTEAAAQENAAKAAATEAVKQQEIAATAVIDAVKAKEGEYDALQEAQKQRDAANAASTQAIEQRDAAETAKAVAEQAQRISLARQLAAQAKDLTQIHQKRADSVDRELPLLLSLESSELVSSLDPIYRSEVKSSLLEVMNLFPEWNTPSSGEPIPLQEMEGTRMWSFAISPDKVILASGGYKDGRIWLWNTDGQLIRDPLEGFPAQTIGLTFSSDGQILASLGCSSASETGCSQRSIRLWDVSNSGRLLDEVNLLEDCGTYPGILFSPDSAILISYCRNVVKLWTITSEHQFGSQEYVVSPGSSEIVNAIAISSSGQYLAIGRGNIVQLWDITDLSNPQQRGISLNYRESIAALAFSPDENILAVGGGDKTGTDKDIKLWNIPAGTPHGHPLVGHDASVISLAFNANGTKLVSGDGNGMIRLWDVETGQLIGSEYSIDGYIYKTAFSKDDKDILVGTDNKTFWTWHLNSYYESLNLDSLRSRACTFVSRNLTGAEYAQYIDADPEAYNRYTQNPTCPK